jgi:hypothetical protein
MVRFKKKASVNVAETGRHVPQRNPKVRGYHAKQFLYQPFQPLPLFG